MFLNLYKKFEGIYAYSLLKIRYYRSIEKQSISSATQIQIKNYYKEFND
jgi:hypothetical protein